MRRRLVKITAYSVMSVLTVLLIAAVTFYVRLGQGPVELSFMTDTIQSQINRNLSGMSVNIGGAVIERAAGSGVPHFRLRNIELKDDAGNLIARAPRAAIGIDERAVLMAQLVPTSIELIGPRIRVMRNLGGDIELGFGDPVAENLAVTIDAQPGAAEGGKTDQEPVGTWLQPAGGTASLIRILSGEAEDEEGTIQTIETIRVADAAIKFYDEANDAIWDVPKAELVFQRMPYGFAVVANAEVSNGPQEGAWHADMTASYRKEKRSFSVSLRVSDLVPANISDEIFALSQLARVKVPLAGHVEMEVAETGLVTKASAEFSAAAGEVGLPDYLAEPLIVNEGSLRADYDPVTASVVVTDSNLLVGSSRVQMQGNIVPVRDKEGRLSAVKISLQARSAALDADGPDAAAVDRVDFIGTAGIERARLDIDDLVVMSGNTGVRLRGVITGGNESPGLLLSGRVRDLSAALLRKLWPPIMAPKTRAWINENVSDGRISDGEFQINLPIDALAKAQRDYHLPDKSINLGFRLAGVTTRYFKDLPPLTNASGEARLIDNDFTLKVESADVTLESGKTGRLEKSEMVASDILADETLAHFDLDVRAAAPALIEYLSHPVLDLVRHSGFDASKLSGDTEVKVALELPLTKDVPKDRVVAKASAHISSASLKDALPGIDIADGEIDLTLAEGQFSAAGPAKISGIPVKLNWRRGAGRDAAQSAVIETELDGEQRQRIGIDLGEFVHGPVGLKATINDLGDPEGKVAVEADLSEADMRISAINWVRPATKDTHATFNYFSKGKKGRRVEDIVVKGAGLLIKGDASLDAKGGVRELHMTDVRLSDENIFTLAVKNADDGTTITLKGDSFDARPLIKSMFGTRRPRLASGDGQPPLPMTISVNLDRIYAYRSEALTGVSGNIVSRGSKVEAAEISGTFLSGQPVVFSVNPVNGGREMRINGRDGGAAMRAANLYSKVAGGQIEFYALLLNDANSTVKQGQLVLRNFQVRNEAALAELDRRGRPKNSGPRKDVLSFSRLTLPFSADSRFIRICDSLVKGNELGASAEGLIRKSDGAVDITGNIIPAYALNSFVSGIPLVGDILTGGRGQGIFGVSFALGGNMEAPVFQMNPVSAVAPGILRKFFEYRSTCDSQMQSFSRNSDKESN